MKQTENYQLNQWELTDRIRMEDFNGDNEKIDAALNSQAEALAAETAARAGGDLYVKLLDVSHTGSANTCTIDVSQINFMDYWAVYLFYELGSAEYANLQLNNITSGYQSGTHNSNVNFYEYSRIGVLYPDTLVHFHPVTSGKIAVTLQTLVSSMTSQDFIAPVTWPSLQRLTFTLLNGTAPYNARFALYGVKR